MARADVGKASGASNLLQELGGIFGIAVAVAAFAAAGGYESPGDFLTGFGPGMGVAAGLALAGLAASLGVPPRARATVA